MGIHLFIFTPVHAEAHLVPNAGVDFLASRLAAGVGKSAQIAPVVLDSGDTQKSPVNELEPNPPKSNQSKATSAMAQAPSESTEPKSLSAEKEGEIGKTTDQRALASESTEAPKKWQFDSLIGTSLTRTSYLSSDYSVKALESPVLKLGATLVLPVSKITATLSGGLRYAKQVATLGSSKYEEVRAGLFIEGGLGSTLPIEMPVNLVLGLGMWGTSLSDRAKLMTGHFEVSLAPNTSVGSYFFASVAVPISQILDLQFRYESALATFMAGLSFGL